jgi:hypothetical protein
MMPGDKKPVGYFTLPEKLKRPLAFISGVSMSKTMLSAVKTELPICTLKESVL